METPTMSEPCQVSLTGRTEPCARARSFSSSSKWSLYSITSSSNENNSTTFWQTPPGTWKSSISKFVPVSIPGFSHFRQYASTRYLGLIIFIAAVLFVLLVPLPRGSKSQMSSIPSFTMYRPIRPELPASDKRSSDPVRWLEENSNNRYAIADGVVSRLSTIARRGRPRAALISLVRNSELSGISQSIRQLEARWNRKYQYPWIFFNDEPFTDQFKEATQSLTSARCFYEVVPKEHWSLPEWIDEGRFLNGLEYLGTIGVGKGWMVSYHHMCRWNSGFFYKHPALRNYDYYWRVEPDVHYFCDIEYDVFRFLRDNNLKYGFNMNILDDARSFPSLWSRTRAFVTTNPHFVHPEADLKWLLDPTTGEYNNCQFFSNFEIGNLNFWRDEASERYFEWLDKSGGFFYERFGDAPVHTLSVSMFLPKSEIWFFRDIGYQHDINHHCPPHREDKCSCQPTSLDHNFYKLVPLKSPQLRPNDTCIRQFLGGDWLKTKENWTQAGERAFGGDGYHGYELLGDE